MSTEQTVSVPQTRDTTAGPHRGLRRDLTVLGVIGAAIASQAPSAGAAIDPQGMVSSAGRAAGLAALISCAGVLCVFYGFVRLSQHFSHSGSAYALVGATLGPRAGVTAGWTLCGVYAGYTMTGMIIGGIYLTAFLNAIGVSISSADGPYAIGLVTAAIAFTLAIFPVRVVGKTLLRVEVVTMSLIVLVCAVVIVKILSGSAPHGQPFTLNMFTVPHEVTTSALFLGVTIGFLFFAGSEAAAVYGEETSDPRRTIPRALIAVIAVLCVFFLFIMTAEMMGFGTGSTGINALVNSSSTIGTLGHNYIGSWCATLLDLGVAISGLSVGVAALVGSTRILFALSRDAFGHRLTGRIHTGTGVPRLATTAVFGFAIGVGLLIRLIWDPTPLNFFIWVGTTATYGILLVYLGVTIGAARFVFLGKVKRAPLREAVVPIVGVVLLVYTLYRSIFPIPSGPPQYFPYIVIGWVAMAVVVVIAAPRYVRTVAEKLDDAMPLE